MSTFEQLLEKEAGSIPNNSTKIFNLEKAIAELVGTQVVMKEILLELKTEVEQLKSKVKSGNALLVTHGSVIHMLYHLILKKDYNYYFKSDVEFKDAWYGGHEGILERWNLLNSLDEKFFPMHISNLITGSWGKTNSAIVYDPQYK
jgi:hypothetical protein